MQTNRATGLSGGNTPAVPADNLMREFRRIGVLRYVKQQKVKPSDLILDLLNVKNTDIRLDILFSMGFQAEEVALVCGVTVRTVERWKELKRENKNKTK